MYTLCKLPLVIPNIDLVTHRVSSPFLVIKVFDESSPSKYGWETNKCLYVSKKNIVYFVSFTRGIITKY